MPLKVRLTRKLAQIINGIDLSRARAGEELELSTRDAEVLIAEGWAALLDSAQDRAPRSGRPPRKRAARH